MQYTIDWSTHKKNRENVFGNNTFKPTFFRPSLDRNTCQDLKISISYRLKCGSFFSPKTVGGKG